MVTTADKKYSDYLWRGGRRIEIEKAPYIAARLKRNVKPDQIAMTYRLQHLGMAARQKLRLFAVEESNIETTLRKMKDAGEVEYAAYVYCLTSDRKSQLIEDNEITLVFQSGVSVAEIEKIAADNKLNLIKELSGSDNTYVFQVSPDANESPHEIVNRLVAESDIVMVGEPNVVVRTRRFYTPSDDLYPKQWHLNHNGGVFLSAESHMDLAKAWDIERGQRSIVVAVADDSVDINHRDLQGVTKIVSPVDFAGGDFQPLPDTPDDNHGTACAGVAVAEENGHGVVGVAPGCALMPIRTSGWLDDNSIEDLFDWVVNRGASVVSCSWGAALHNYSLTLRQATAIHKAATQGRNGLGCVILFAAGNDNRPVDGVIEEQGWPNGEFTGPTQWFNGFAVHKDVIAVAASTSLAKKSAYSNWGLEISVAAPSNNAPPSTFPAVTQFLPGRGVLTTDRVGPVGYSSTNYTFHFGGTSSACPAAAGVAALVLSANPFLRAEEVKKILQDTADKIEDHEPDSQLGNTFGTYNDHGHSLWFGHGKVNAYRAVSEAVSRRTGSALVTVHKISTPKRIIPDNNLVGINDQINISEHGNVLGVKVHVDISHSWKADLVITLISPSDTSVVLHDRSGGSSNDIRQSFDAQSISALNRLTGETLHGDWTIKVQDLAARDVGKLNRWELEVEGRIDNVVTVQEAPGVAIPDNDPSGIERVLQVTQTGTVKEVSVFVDLTHPYIQDINLVLISPAGTSVVLHNRSGGSADNIIATYTMSTTPALLNLAGEAVEGPWKLRAADLAGADVGKLNQWELKIVLGS